MKHWFALVNYGYRTGDTAPIQELSMSECTVCADYVSLIRDLTRDGSRLSGDVVDVDTVNAPPVQDGLVAVSVTYSQPISDVLDPSGRPTDSVTAEPIAYLQAALVWEDQWMLLELGT